MEERPALNAVYMCSPAQPTPPPLPVPCSRWSRRDCGAERRAGSRLTANSRRAQAGFPIPHTRVLTARWPSDTCGHRSQRELRSVTPRRQIRQEPRGPPASRAEGAGVGNHATAKKPWPHQVLKRRRQICVSEKPTRAPGARMRTTSGKSPQQPSRPQSADLMGASASPAPFPRPRPPRRLATNTRARNGWMGALVREEVRMRCRENGLSNILSFPYPIPDNWPKSSSPSPCYPHPICVEPKNMAEFRKDTDLCITCFSLIESLIHSFCFASR